MPITYLNGLLVTSAPPPWILFLWMGILVFILNHKPKKTETILYSSAWTWIFIRITILKWMHWLNIFWFFGAFLLLFSHFYFSLPFEIPHIASNANRQIVEWRKRIVCTQRFESKRFEIVGSRGRRWNGDPVSGFILPIGHNSTSVYAMPMRWHKNLYWKFHAENSSHAVKPTTFSSYMHDAWVSVEGDEKTLL